MACSMSASPFDCDGGWRVGYELPEAIPGRGMYRCLTVCEVYRGF